jgi:hypothetical protein
MAGAEGRIVRPADGLARMREPWPVAERGMPINQEDLAYTLQTFAHTIVQGLTHWGLRLDARDRHAFLHLWRLTGHVLGVEEELLTDDEEEAAALFEAIGRRQSAASEEGQHLTEALVGLLRGYLPGVFAVDVWLPPTLMRDQVGAEVAAMVLPEIERRRATHPLVRGAWLLCRGILRFYYLLRHLILERIPWLKEMTTGSFHRGGEALIESLRDTVSRGTFDIPALDDSDWLPRTDRGAEFHARLHHWQGRVVRTLLAGVVVFVLAITAFPLVLLTPAARWPGFVEVAVVCLALAVLVSWFFLRGWMEHLLVHRPQP